MFRKKKFKEYFILLLLLFSVITIVLPISVKADDPTIEPYVAPGAPGGISVDQLLKIGILHDMTHKSGEHAWNGAMLAAREINEAGGLFINSTYFYIGLVAENTYEAIPELDISRSLEAANIMIDEYKPHIITGGFRMEALIEYIEPIMDAKIPFICTGSTSDIFSQNVLDNYTRYKYFFRNILNGSKLGSDIINYIPYLANEMTNIIDREVTKIAILREDLAWSVPLANALKFYLPFFGLEIVNEIALPLNSSEIDVRESWYQIDNSGAQIVVSIFSSALGILAGRTYGEIQPKCIVCGINVEAQLNNYWDDTSGNSQYEILMQGTYKTNKTSKTIPFWNNYVNNYTIEPLYTAISSYDSIYLLVNASLFTQSFNAKDIIYGLELINCTNTFTGVNGHIAFTSSHDLRGGTNYVTSLFCQWQEGGNKVVLSSGNFLYPDSFATGSLSIPTWGINPRELIYGVGYGPYNLEPYNAWESNSVEVIDQVVESLFACNLTDPDLSIIPRLASDFGVWSEDKLNYTVDLKQGVLFHDGTSFNASVVQWNFNRLAYFMNISGSLPNYLNIPVIDSLFRWPDGTPIINRTEVIESYKIKFILNRPYGALEAIFSFWGTGILSPTSTPEIEYIDTTTGDLVGTGPFVFDEYVEGSEVQFHAFNEYRDGVAEMKILKFIIIGDINERNEALLSETIDFLDSPLTSMIDTFEEAPFITINQCQNTVVRYISMNNNFINKTMRQAISYSINYSYIIDVLLNGEATRLKSPIPEGILYANWSFNVANYNITKAREILVSGGVCNFNISNDNEWLDASNNNPIAIYNYSYPWGSQIREDLGNLLFENLVKIGIKVVLKGLDYNVFVDRYLWDNDKLELCYLGWGPDYNDPSNFINNLFSNNSNSNLGQVNDPILENLINQGLTKVDPVLREAIYDDIQQYIVEDLMPYAFTTVGFNYDVYHKAFIGYPSNPMEKVWFYPVKLQDITPPQTSINLLGDQSQYGWFETDISIRFTAFDDFSGVQATEYSFDGETWSTFVDPIIISNEGRTLIYYRSIDYEGNMEEIKIGTICRYSFFSPRDLVFGTNTDISNLDPLDAWDVASINVFDQVIEGLFTYNLTHPEMEIIPKLASDYGTWSGDKLNYTVDLKQGILFHDGTKLNASAVLWNFNRIAYFMNISGTLPSSQHKAMLDPLFRWPDGTPIINHTEVLDTYRIRFVLNRPYAALEAILSVWGTSILSPTSTPENEYIDTLTGNLVSTGPFIIDFHIQDTVVKFNSYEHYWQERSNLETLIFAVIQDNYMRNEALLSGNVDFILNPEPSMFEEFEDDPSITLFDAGNTGGVRYIGMNNNHINKTIRQAISYAINYSFITDIILEDQGIRVKSPISNGLLYANWTFNVATINITKSRQILIDAGVISGLDPLNDSHWTDLVDIGTPIAVFNYSYNIENWYREALLHLLEKNLRMIGIQVLDDGMDSWEFFSRLFNWDGSNRDMLDIFDFGWGPDFNDPSNIVNNLLSNESYYNFVQVNDPYLEDLMAQGLAETDSKERKPIYDEIQKYLVEDLMPCGFSHTMRNFYVFNNEFTGYEPNILQKLYFYTVSRISLPISNETVEWGVESGDQPVWNVSGYWLDYWSFMLHQENPVQWMMDIREINLTFWKDLSNKQVPYDYYSTIWATMYNRSVTEGTPWEEWMPLSSLTFYNTSESIMYNQFFADIMQNWIYLVIPTPINLDLLNSSIYTFWSTYISGYGFQWIDSAIIDNSLFITLDVVWDTFTFNYTYNDRGILTYLRAVNSTDNLWFEMVLQDLTAPNWIVDPIDQIVELGSRFIYQISAFDESGISYYWINNTEKFEIDNSGLIKDLNFLELGSYELEVRAYDPFDHYCSAKFTVNVVDSTSPYGIGSIYDTIPNETILIYTRNPQIIGSLKIFDNSPITNIELWNIDPIYGEEIDEGFSLITTHYPKSPLGVYNHSYTSEIVIMTTISLTEGKHSLNLRVYDAQGNIASKNCNITVYRKWELKLSGEFDYLEAETIKFSISAYLIDVESGDPIIPTDNISFTLNLIFVNPTGDILGTVEMEHLGLGVYRYISQWTIEQLQFIFTKGIYLVYCYVDFDGDNQYYSVKEDVIQFHIDPPANQNTVPSFILIISGIGGVLLINAITILLYRRKRLKI